MTKNELNAFARTLENRHSELKNGSRNREALAIETSPDELDRIQHASDRDYAMGSLERTSPGYEKCNPRFVASKLVCLESAPAVKRTSI
jgi:hypothetical protein